MDVREARGILSGWDEEDEEPATLLMAVLSQLNVKDVPNGAMIRVGTWAENVLHLDWSGTLGRDDVLWGEADHTMTRKYWYSPLGLEQYLDLVRRAVETRHRVCGDVKLAGYDDDGAYVSLRFQVSTMETNLGKAYDAIRKVATEVEEVAEHAANEVGQRIAEIAARLSGWGSESLDALVDAVEKAASADDKG